jgi:enoyl-CoA hydratase/carnithine racemase
VKNLLFVNKKKQKNFLNFESGYFNRTAQTDKSFFASFFSKKEDASFLSLAFAFLRFSPQHAHDTAAGEETKMQSYHPNLPVSRDGEIAIVTFDRPEVRNAFNLSMWRGLQLTMDALSGIDDLRCIILRGAGPAFSAGADIAGFAAERGTPEQEEVYATALHEGMQSIRLCQHPVVAEISGFCLGGGAGIATMCDFRVGGEAIRFGITARNLSLWYPYAELDPIVQLVGSGVAAELLIEGRIFSGQEAYEKGLLSRLVADDDVFNEAMALAERISSGAPLSARFHKSALQRLRGPLPITAEEDRAVSDFVLTEDFRNAVQAFKAKRKPVWLAR